MFLCFFHPSLNSFSSRCFVYNLLILCRMAVVVISYAVDPKREAVHDASSAIHENVNWAHLPIATGILVVSLSGILDSIYTLL